MIKFTKDGKFIYVTIEGAELPQTAIKCLATDNDEILKTCQSWLEGLGMADRDYQVNVRIH